MKAITTRYLGPTNHHGSRVKATEADGSSVTVNYDHALSPEKNHGNAARSLADDLNWPKVRMYGGHAKGGAMVWVLPNDDLIC